MAATLRVNHVAKNARLPEKFPAYSVMIGQIHADKDKVLMQEGNGFGYGNRALKIYYKKWPEHDFGSVFWIYEKNLAKKDPNRQYVAYQVWGNTWDNPTDPGYHGIAIGKSFSYEVNVSQDVMCLTFEADGYPTTKHQINLANNVDAFGKVDTKDNPKGDSEDWHYFKAGAYNQCSIKEQDGFWYPGCAGSGD